VPGYVEEELRGYLECGLLCFGFARALCTGCGQAFVVAFSCKSRGEGAPNHATPRSHDTSRISWAKLLARLGEEFPLECPNCGGDIRLRGDGRQEPAHFEPEVRKREKARMASPA
jgi:hypothetical protein